LRGPADTLARASHVDRFPQYVATDSGDVYFTSIYGNSFNCVVKMDMSGVVTCVAGNGRQGLSGDGVWQQGPKLNRPLGLVVDAAANLYIAETGTAHIRKVFPDGIITTVAGNGPPGFSGDGGPATEAQTGFAANTYTWAPLHIAVDRAGNLFIADAGRTRNVSPDGIINTLVEGISGPMAIDMAGNLFVANSNFNNFNAANVVVKIAPDGTMITVAGGGHVSGKTLGWSGVSSSACLDDLSGDGGPATQAGLCALTRIASDAAGNLFVGEEF
jgi:hypothetical protein